MEKEKYYEELKEILLLDVEINEETGIEIDSMGSLLLIAFLDENFNKTISQERIKDIKSVKDITHIIGSDNFK